MKSLDDNYGIRAILYPNGKHEAVAIILERLLQNVNRPTWRENSESKQNVQNRRHYCSPEYTQICTDLKKLLNQTRETHPSFKLMDSDYDKKLLPGLRKIKRFVPQGITGADRASNPVWKLIQATWNEDENHSIIIQGDGGIGKTVALLSFTEDAEGEEWPPAFYIPLYELAKEDNKILSVSEYLLHRLPEKASKILDLAGEEWDNGPSLLLLLDGINEIPLQLRDLVLQEINTWHNDHNGAQLILVSRPLESVEFSLLLDGKIVEIHLSALDRSEVTTYLKDNGLEIPDDNSPVWEVLVLPLFLTLYAKSDRLKSTAACGYTLQPKPVIGPGTIIWNYLQRELLQKRREKWVIKCAVTCEYLLPAIAYDMVQQQRFELPRRRISELIEKALNCKWFEYNNLPDHLAAILDAYQDKHDANLNLAEYQWEEFVIREIGIIVPARSQTRKRNTPMGEKCFEFLHQSFRDCLAAIHLVNVAEATKTNELPAEWRHYNTSDVLDYVAELIDHKLTFADLWEAFRVHRPVNRAEADATINNMLALVCRFSPIPTNLDFSEMDLRGVSLTNYMGQGEFDLGLFHNPYLSQKTLFDRETFQGRGHSRSVKCITILPDGRMISGSEDQMLRVWDPSTGYCLQTLKGHTSRINCVAYLPTGEIVSGSYDGTLRIWDPNTGQCLHVLKGHEGSVKCMVVLSGGQVVSGSADHTIKVWDTITGKCLKTMEDHSLSVNCIAAMPDGRIVSGSSDCTLKIWSPVNGQCLNTLEGHTDIVTCVSMLSDGTIISGSLDGTLIVWDPSTGKSLANLNGHASAVNCVFALPNGKAISGSDDSTLHVWDTKTGNSLRTLEGHTDRITCICVLSEDYVVSGSEDKTLRVWKLSTGDCTKELNEHTHAVECVAALKNSHIVSGSYRSIKIWDIKSEKSQLTMASRSHSVASILSLSNNTVVVGSTDGSLRIWDYINKKNKGLLGSHTRSVEYLSKMVNGEIVSGSYDGMICIWNPNNRTCMYQLNCKPKEITGVAVLPDEKIVYSSKDNKLRLWNPATNEVLAALDTHKKSITCVAVMPDGRIVSGSYDKSLMIWDASLTNCEHKLTGHEKAVFCVRPLKQGWIASGSLDYTIRIWDVDKEQCLFPPLHGHKGAINDIAELPDGRVISGSDDGTICIWNLQKGADPVAEMQINCHCAIYCLTVLSETEVLAGSKDGNVYIINLIKGRCEASLEATEVDVSQMKFYISSLDRSLAEMLKQNNATVLRENEL